jgi:hypothetical protein
LKLASENVVFRKVNPCSAESYGRDTFLQRRHTVGILLDNIWNGVSNHLIKADNREGRLHGEEEEEESQLNSSDLDSRFVVAPRERKKYIERKESKNVKSMSHLDNCEKEERKKEKSHSTFWSRFRRVFSSIFSIRRKEKVAPDVDHEEGSAVVFRDSSPKKIVRKSLKLEMNDCILRNNDISFPAVENITSDCNRRPNAIYADSNADGSNRDSSDSVQFDCHESNSVYLNPQVTDSFGNLLASSEEYPGYGDFSFVAPENVNKKKYFEVCLELVSTEESFIDDMRIVIEVW